MNLYAGKMLVVDLTSGQLTTEPLRRDWVRDYWGAWGLASRYYWDAVAPDVEPLSPENAIVIMTGPLSGTLVPLAARLCLVSKSPHTGTIFESNVGGAFGPELKFAGYDGIIIKGRADKPSFLKIVDDKVSLESAVDLVGKGIFATEKAFEKAIGSPDAKSLAIGPAAENLITYSIIGSEAYRQFGRGGTGALFGSKNLKGIVCRGTGKVAVADIQSFLAVVDKHNQENLFTADNLWVNTDGTPILVDVTNEMGIHPTHNYTKGFNKRKKALNSEAMQAAKIGSRACAGCPLGCGIFTSINGAQVEGPEYETLCLAGSNCDVNDLEPVIRFNRLCDDYGLDTMTCSSTLSLAMEMASKGLYDFGLRFGETDGYLKVIEEIATLSTERGRELSVGTKKLAEKYQVPELSMDVKGLEMPAYDPRGSYGMGVAYATSERGACHLRAFTIFEKDPFDIEAQVTAVINGQNFNSIKWAMCICDFWGSVNSSILSEILSVGLGETVTPEELDLAGERIWNLNRLFNLRAGFTSTSDTLPAKIFNKPIEEGPHAGKVFSKNDFALAMQSYYQKRGWDLKGVPTPQKLSDLGLDQM